MTHQHHQPGARRRSPFGPAPLAFPAADADAAEVAANEIGFELGLAEKDEYTLIVGSLPMMRVAGKTNLLHIRRLGS